MPAGADTCAKPEAIDSRLLDQGVPPRDRRARQVTPGSAVSYPTLLLTASAMSCPYAPPRSGLTACDGVSAMPEDVRAIHVRAPHVREMRTRRLTSAAPGWRRR
jgi:hypothetical protein